MYNFTEELVAMPYAGRFPTYDFWLVDFNQYVMEKNLSTDPSNFTQNLDQFLNEEIYESHKEDIVLDKESGNMLASRTILAYDNHDFEDVKQTVDALELQEEISKNQRINRGRKDWAFFTWSGAL